MNLLNFKNFTDDRGELVFISDDIPFNIKRIFYIYGIPKGAERGGHAHKKCQQIIIPISGKFEVKLVTPMNINNFVLNDPKIGLYVGVLTWAELFNFNDDSICLVLASELYDEADYFRDFKQYTNYLNGDK